MNSKARLQVISAAVLFSTGGAAIKVAAFSAPQVSALRSAIATLALLLVFWPKIAWSRTAALIGVVYAATLTLFVLSTKLTTAANAIFLQSTASLYILLLAPRLLQEPIRRRDVTFLIAIAVGMVACFLGQPFTTTTAPDPATGNVVGVVCSIAWALTLLSLRWAERGGEREGLGLTAVVSGNLMAAAVSLPFALPFPAASSSEWATVVYLGVFQIGLAYVFLTAAIRHLPALEVSLLLLLEPVLNPVWTWLVRGERPGTWTVVGGAVIVTATAIKTIYDAHGRPADRFRYSIVDARSSGRALRPTRYDTEGAWQVFPYVCPTPLACRSKTPSTSSSPTYGPTERLCGRRIWMGGRSSSSAVWRRACHTASAPSRCAIDRLASS